MQQEMPTETNKGQLGFKVSLAVTGPSSSKQMKQEMECVAFFSLARPMAQLGKLFCRWILCFALFGIFTMSHD